MSLFAKYVPRAEPRQPLDGLVIRKAISEDLDELAEIVAGREEESPEIWRPRLERSLQECSAGKGLFLVGVTELEIVGYGKAAWCTPPPDAPANAAPEGWYLTGMVVRPAYRRRGIGEALTAARISWIAGHSNTIYYFANAANGPTIDLHSRFGFAELARDFHVPGVRFTGGVGILFRLDVSRSAG